MAPPTNLKQWLQGLPISWLVGEEVGRADAGAQGDVYDGQVALLREATRARFPGEGYAPDDALPEIGKDRQLIQGTGESNATFRTRLLTAWDQHALRGTWVELLFQMYFSCGIEAGGAYIIQQNGLIYSLSANPTAGEDPTPLLVVDEAPIDYVTFYPLEVPFRLLGVDREQCVRFAIVFPSPWLGPFRTLAVAEFDDANTATVTWADSIPGAYSVLLGAPVVADDDGAIVCSADYTTQTANGLTITASAPFTGSVVVLAVPDGANPFANILPSQLAILRTVVKRWEPAKALCTGFSILTAPGNVWGWPMERKWGSGGKWGAAGQAAVHFELEGT